MRIASFNVENLFSRAKVLNLANKDTGTDLLKQIGELKELLKAKTYTAPNRKKILDEYKKLSKYIEITEDRGKLFKKSGTKIVGIKANGVDDWDGTIQFKRDKFDETTRINTAKTMKEVKADVFCIVEVENRETLSFFNSELLGTKKFPFNMCIDGNDPRGIDVGLLSRFSIKNMRTHIFDKKSSGKPVFPRDCLEVELAISATKSLHILCNHLTSKLSDKTGQKRKIQAAALKNILTTHYNLQTDLVIVAGDFNDTPDSAALTDVFTVPDLSDVLQLQFGNNMKDRWTYHYQNKFDQIDYLLVSEPLKNAFVKAGVERKGMFGVAGLPGMTETPFPTVTSDANAASDHGAVWADFNI